MLAKDALRSPKGVGGIVPLPLLPYPDPVRVLFAPLLIALLARGDVSPRPLPLTAVTLWSWERADDLRWLSGSGVRVAMLDRTLVVRDGRLDVQLRRQPLRLADDTPLMSVVRIETDGRPLPSPLVSALADQIGMASRVPRASAVQIDFDARQSERDFYRVLLKDVRTRLSPSQRLSMTALASWCAEDPWIDEDGVDEIVPMLFEMGPDAARVVTSYRDNRAWSVGACNLARGISTAEPWPGLPPVSQIYVWRARSADTTTMAVLVNQVRDGGLQ
jgi:hypothetical protein